MSQPEGDPDISVIILNYNGAKWLDRCLATLRQQTIFQRIEVIVADNASSDGSDQLAQKLLEGWPNGRFIDNGGNLGYCAGNNRGAEAARGKYLFFLNNDTWLEADCLEKLLSAVESANAGAANPLVLDYDDDTMQSLGASGFDFFGLTDAMKAASNTVEIFAACGAAYFISTGLFRQLGGFDGEFFLYSDETDLSWRAWIAGCRVVAVPSARMHHRGAAAVNPAGGTRIVESRTSTAKRFYATRNGILFLLKNSQHFLLMLLIPHLLLLAIEAFASLLVVRRWSFVREAYLSALADCWRLRAHIAQERKRIKGFRRHGDFWMLRFLRWRPSRWEEVRRVFRAGLPKVDYR
jgi:GT2 family glycosyltransferase